MVLMALTAGALVAPAAVATHACAPGLEVLCVHPGDRPPLPDDVACAIPPILVDGEEVDVCGAIGDAASVAGCVLWKVTGRPPCAVPLP